MLARIIQDKLAEPDKGDKNSNFFTLLEQFPILVELLRNRVQFFAQLTVLHFIKKSLRFNIKNLTYI